MNIRDTTVLLAAASRGDLETFEAYQRCLELIARELHTETAFWAQQPTHVWEKVMANAMSNGHVELVEWLADRWKWWMTDTSPVGGIHNGDGIDRMKLCQRIQQHNGIMPIREAVACGWLDVVKLQHPEHCSVSMCSSYNPQVAAEYGQAQCMVWLMENCKFCGIDCHSRSLNTAVEFGHLNVIQAYIKERCTIRRALEAAEISCNSGPEVFSDAIITAAKRGHLEVLKLLEQQFHNLSSSYWSWPRKEYKRRGDTHFGTILCAATETGQCATVAHLLEGMALHGQNWNTFQRCVWKVMHVAIKHGQTKVLEYLWTLPLNHVCHNCAKDTCENTLSQRAADGARGNIPPPVLNTMMMPQRHLMDDKLMAALKKCLSNEHEETFRWMYAHINYAWLHQFEELCTHAKQEGLPHMHDYIVSHTSSTELIQQTVILTMIKEGSECNNGVGLSRTQLQQKQTNPEDFEALDDVLEHLINEGMIYTTIDDDHFHGTDF